ncbi:hypothetical protein LNKW23_08400 [Paralimibaculum aggregatum]|uniref:Type I-U CRISPR-associated protein Cas5/Cas6 n=2 Tax=Paralimibaculum aggregatum TaxID=3036245 RepID=A0ABQ6LF61_9RHOB|nr:hypothetical protein LNKW23_08400 [Limibaculum sp. NKW23]
MACKSKQPAPPAWQPDETVPGVRHPLEGLEPGNLLAFMALLGLLRALEMARPHWRSRSYWDVETHPWRPVLTLAGPQTQADVARAAAEGAHALLSPVEGICSTAAIREKQKAQGRVKEPEAEIEEAKKQGKPTKKLQGELNKQGKRANQLRDEHKTTTIAASYDDLEYLVGSQDAERESWVACLAAWVPGKDGRREVRSSPLKLTSGQQAFAGVFVTLARDCDPMEIARSLFQPWRYMHRGDSFRFDGAEARRYAYLAGDPTDKKLWTVPGQTGKGVAPSERGANILAAVGFRAFPVITLRHGVVIPGMGRKNHEWLSVPIWTAKGGRGATRAGIERLLWQGGNDNLPPRPDVLGWQRFRIFEISDSPTSKYKSVAYDGLIDSNDMAAAPPP